MSEKTFTAGRLPFYGIPALATCLALVLTMALNSSTAFAGTSTSSTGTDVVEKSDQKLPVTFSLLFDSVHDDNIYLSNQNKVADFYWLVNPGITYESGDPEYQPDQFLRVWYKPRIYQFWDETKNNSFDQDLLFDYHAYLGHLNLGVSQTYYTDSTPTPDTGGRLKAQYYGTRIFANYALTPHLTWENEATQMLSRYDNSNTIETNAWTASTYLDYALTPKVNLAAGGTVGYVVLSQHPDQYYEQGNLRLKYKATNKIDLTAQVGAEYRQYEHSNETSLSPVFSLGAELRPFSTTTINLKGECKTVPSITQADQNYRTYGLSGALRQKVWSQFFLNLASGYYHSFYYNTPAGESSGYVFDYITVRPGLEYELNKYVTIGAYYQHQTNISNQNDQSFLDNQVGLQGSFKY